MKDDLNCLNLPPVKYAECGDQWSRFVTKKKPCALTCLCGSNDTDDYDAHLKMLEKELNPHDYVEQALADRID